MRFSAPSLHIQMCIRDRYMIDDDLCGKCSSYRPVGIGCCNRILDTLDISHTAVVKGSTEAYYQNLVLTDLILIAGIILGSISGI